MNKNLLIPIAIVIAGIFIAVAIYFTGNKTTAVNAPQAAVTKRGLESFAKEGVEPSEGTFHGARLNRYVDIPIALVKNDDDTFSITDGMHRAVQAFISGEKTILAFVDGGHGPTLKNIFDTFKQEAVKN